MVIWMNIAAVKLTNQSIYYQAGGGEEAEAKNNQLFKKKKLFLQGK